MKLKILRTILFYLGITILSYAVYLLTQILDLDALLGA